MDGEQLPTENINDEEINEKAGDQLQGYPDPLDRLIGFQISGTKPKV